jgi:hypothetical protein
VAIAVKAAVTDSDASLSASSSFRIAARLSAAVVKAPSLDRSRKTLPSLAPHGRK